MASSDNDAFDDLDAFFDAAGKGDAEGVSVAADQLIRKDAPTRRRSRTTGVVAKVSVPSATSSPPSDRADTMPAPEGPDSNGREGQAEDHGGKAEGVAGEFVALDAALFAQEVATDEPFVLVPARLHTHVPWWGWITIATGLVALVAAIVLMPYISLWRTTDNLADDNPAVYGRAMSRLVAGGNDHTVRRLYAMAASPSEKMNSRLRAVDTMALIEGVPEVDRALLRLELSGDMHERIRAAAIAARRQREAYHKGSAE